MDAGATQTSLIIWMWYKNVLLKPVVRLERVEWLETIERHKLISYFKTMQECHENLERNLKYIHANWLLYLLGSQWQVAVGTFQ